ncbi:MAG: nucleotidyltransferase domain-containing protein [Syntrophobacteraceae bacterium]
MTEIYIFGSVTSGTVDPGSDVDVLALLNENMDGKHFPKDWSVYTRAKIRELYARGTLFSWHLFEHAVLVYPRETAGFLKSIGMPAPYTCAAEEIGALKILAQEASYELHRGTPSAIYEFGILYVSARDIAMAASCHLLGRFTFSRFAPFDLPDTPFPLESSEYRFLMDCRRASIRGRPQPVCALVEAAVLAKRDRLLRWCERIERMVLSCRNS